MAYRISRFIFWLCCKICFGFRSFGRAHIPRRGGFILASNHVSYLDPIVLGIGCPRTLVYLARDTLFANPLLGWWMRAVNVVAIKRSSADISALRRAIQAVRSGQGVALFPEGSRQDGGQPAEPLAGVGFLAAKLNVPVIPAFIRGSEVALPKGARRLHPAHIRVYYGRQILIERGMPYQQIAQQIMQQIRHLACTH